MWSSGILKLAVSELMEYRQKLAKKRAIVEKTTDRQNLQNGTYLDEFGRHAFWAFLQKGPTPVSMLIEVLLQPYLEI